MLRSILIGLDGSSYSEPAVELGIQWAGAFGAQLVGLGVVDESIIYTREAVPIGVGYYKHERDEELLAHARQQVEHSLEHFAARCRDAGVAYRQIEEIGWPHEKILRESHRHDLIVLGHETHFHLPAEFGPDETLWHVLKRTPRPVVTVPTTLQPGASVVVAYNGSTQAARALQAFEASGLHLGEEVAVLSVGSDEGKAARQAETAADFLRAHHIRELAVGTKPKGSVARTILAEVRQRSARLLVMGAYGHSTFREVVLGSVTDTVLKQSPVPVFLTH